LREAALPDNPINLQGQPRLDQFLLGVPKTEVAKTLPVPSLARGLDFFVAISVPSFSVIARCLCKSLPDKIKLPFRRCNSGLRFLLEGVQYVNGVLKASRIDSPPCVAGRRVKPQHVP
jgi:hypothetical protein